MFFNLPSPASEMKKRYDSLVEQGYISRVKHPIHKLYLYCYTPKTVAEGYWCTETISARGIVLDERGQVISKGLPKIFSYDEVTKFPTTAFIAYEKIDGVGLNAFWYDGKLELYTKSEWDNPYTEYGYLNRNLFQYDHKIRTVGCEAILPEHIDPVKRIVAKPSGIYLTYVLDSRYKDIDILEYTDYWNGKFARAVWEYVLPRKDSEGKFTLEKILKAKSHIENSEGWILRYQDENRTRIKVKTDWFLEMYVKEYNANLMIKQYMLEGRPLQDMLEASEEEMHKDIISSVNSVNDYVDIVRSALGKVYLEIYSPDEYSFKRNLFEYPDTISNLWKDYLVKMYKNQDLVPTLLDEALDKVLKNV